MRNKIAQLVSFIAIFFVFSLNVKAQEVNFDTIIDRDIRLESTGELRVVETHTITNNSTNRLITKDNTETFQIIVIESEPEILDQVLNSAVLQIDNTEYEIKSTIEEKSISVRAAYPREVKKGESIIFRLEYLNPGLIEKQGALYDLYTPGFAEDFKFNKGDTNITYNTKVSVNSSLPEVNLIIPEPVESFLEGDYRVYKFSQESLLGNTVWIQLGKIQYYKFKISQKAPSTDSKDTGYFNEYRIILPRNIEEAEISQKVFYKNFTPEPFQIKTDDQGNLIGYFKVPTHQETNIAFEGYAVVSKGEDKVDESSGGLISDTSETYLKRYTQGSNFWEVESQSIQELAQVLKNQDENVYKIINNTYGYVIDNIDYSQVKRFGLNERQGALKTLENGSGVCMEYSDLFLTLTRAQGIPARAAFGYGYDSRVQSEGQEAHQWVQVYLPGFDKWMSVDVTWGEAAPAMIGGDLNHFYTHVASKNPDTPSMVERISYGETKELDAPDFEIQVIENFNLEEDFLDQTELLNKYPQKENGMLQNNLTAFFSKLNISFGREQLSFVFIGSGFFFLFLSFLMGLKQLFSRSD